MNVAVKPDGLSGIMAGPALVRLDEAGSYYIDEQY